VAARKKGNHGGLPLQIPQMSFVSLLFGCGAAALCSSVSNWAFFSEFSVASVVEYLLLFIIDENIIFL
jgi:hypothetical protein